MSNTCPRCQGRGAVMAQGPGRIGWDFCSHCAGSGKLNPGLPSGSGRDGSGLTGLGLFGLIGGGVGIYLYWPNAESLFGLLVPGTIGAIGGALVERWIGRSGVIGRFIVKSAYGLALFAIGVLVYRIVENAS